MAGCDPSPVAGNEEQKIRTTSSLALGFVAGIAVAGATMALAQVHASVDKNGVLVGYTVQKDGQVVREDPTAYIQFRGRQS